MPGNKKGPGKWIENRADRILNDDLKKRYGKDAERVAYAIATQQAHKLKKTPKRGNGPKGSYGTKEGKAVAKAKFNKPVKEYKKTASNRSYLKDFGSGVDPFGTISFGYGDSMKNKNAFMKKMASGEYPEGLTSRETALLDSLDRFKPRSALLPSAIGGTVGGASGIGLGHMLTRGSGLKGKLLGLAAGTGIGAGIGSGLTDLKNRQINANAQRHGVQTLQALNTTRSPRGRAVGMLYANRLNEINPAAFNKSAAQKYRSGVTGNEVTQYRRDRGAMMGAALGAAIGSLTPGKLKILGSMLGAAGGGFGGSKAVKGINNRNIARFRKEEIKDRKNIYSAFEGGQSFGRSRGYRHGATAGYVAGARDGYRYANKKKEAAYYRGANSGETTRTYNPDLGAAIARRKSQATTKTASVGSMMGKSNRSPFVGGTKYPTEESKQFAKSKLRESSNVAEAGPAPLTPKARTNYSKTMDAAVKPSGAWDLKKEASDPLSQYLQTDRGREEISKYAYLMETNETSLPTQYLDEPRLDKNSQATEQFLAKSEKNKDEFLKGVFKNYPTEKAVIS